MRPSLAREEPQEPRPRAVLTSVPPPAPAPAPAPVPAPAKADESVKEAIVILERRLLKLAGALEDQETLLSKMRHKEEADPGIASDYRSVQGLGETEPGGERKRELMRRIFESNQELRERITSLRRLAE